MDFYKEESNFNPHINFTSKNIADSFMENLHNGSKDNKELSESDISRLENLILESKIHYEAAEADELGKLFNELNNAFEFNFNSIFNQVFSQNFFLMVVDAYDRLLGTDYFISVVTLIANFIKSGEKYVISVSFEKNLFETSETELMETDDKKQFTQFYKIYVWLLKFTGENEKQIDFSKLFTICQKALDARVNQLDILSSELIFNVIKFNDFQNNIRDIIIVSSRLLKTNKNIVANSVLFAIKLLLEAYRDPYRAEVELRNSMLLDEIFSFIDKEDLSVASEQIVCPALELLYHLMMITDVRLCDHYLRNLFKYNNLANAFDNKNSATINDYAAKIICFHISKSQDHGKLFMEKYFHIKKRFVCEDMTFEKIKSTIKVLCAYLLNMGVDAYEMYMMGDFINEYGIILDTEDSNSESVMNYLLACRCLLFCSETLSEKNIFENSFDDEVRDNLFAIAYEAEGNLGQLAKEIVSCFEVEED